MGLMLQSVLDLIFLLGIAVLIIEPLGFLSRPDLYPGLGVSNVFLRSVHMETLLSLFGDGFRDFGTWIREFLT